MGKAFEGHCCKEQKPNVKQSSFCPSTFMSFRHKFQTSLECLRTTERFQFDLRNENTYKQFISHRQEPHWNAASENCIAFPNILQSNDMELTSILHMDMVNEHLSVTSM